MVAKDTLLADLIIQYNHKIGHALRGLFYDYQLRCLFHMAFYSGYDFFVCTCIMMQYSY